MLDVFEVEPTEPLRGTVIWMHGLGATNHDFNDVVPELDTPYLRYVFPAAPIRAVTINGGMPMPAWYDILSFQDPPLRESEPDVRDAALDVSALIHREIERGVPSHKIVLAGFSQGGAMALHVGLREVQPLAGIVVLSGYLVLPHMFDAERSPANTGTPLFMAHGTLDPTVPLSLYRRALQILRAANCQVDDHEYRMGHSLCLPEIADLRQWLQVRFAAGAD